MTSIVVCTGPLLHPGEEATCIPRMIPHETVVVANRERRDILSLIQGKLKEKSVVPEILAYRIFEVFQRDIPNMCWNA